uniref:Tetratricopeptide repeat domain 7A n=1 Tax=Gouania willdenowi TaxID=441366 RepID=A0A8C5DZ08_GOUWI
TCRKLYQHRDKPTMASRVSLTQVRLEVELERYRAEGHWDKIPAMIEQMQAVKDVGYGYRNMKTKPYPHHGSPPTLSSTDDYGLLLMAESLLEECLQENVELLRSCTPLMDKSQPKLGRAKGFLNTILSRGFLTPRFLNEALLLMAKVHYVQGRHRDAQGMCARVGLEELTQDDQPTYHLRLLAEAFVIKGLSLDHQALSSVSRIRLSEREEESLSCYLRACDAALAFLQELDKVLIKQKTHNNFSLFCVFWGNFVYFHCFFFFFCILCILLLSFVYFLESHCVFTLWGVCVRVRACACVLFQCAARKLAEVLLSSVSEDSYWPPLGPPPSAWLCFCPQDVVEEAVLLLLIIESMASGEAVISRMPDQAEARKASLEEATSVYDLLTISMARRGQYAMLCECLERAMKFSFNEFHLWHQLGLSLMAGRKVIAAVSALKECARMRPEDPSLPLLAAKVCIGQLHWLEEAEALSHTVVSMGEEAGEFLSRAYLAMGLCNSLQASDATLKADRNEFNRKALTKKTIQWKCVLNCSQTTSLYVSPSALSLRGDDLHSLHLLTLLLSAQKHQRHALDTVGLALSQHPDNFNLLFTKVKLEEVVHCPAVALHICEEMLQTLVSMGSQSPSSLAASRLEAALSEGVRHQLHTTSGPHLHLDHPGTHLASGELFMADGRLKEAQFCIAEASAIFPNSHSVLLQRGRLAELRGQLDEAKCLYDEALTFVQRYNQTLFLIHVFLQGRLLVKSGRGHLGEKVLRDAVQIHCTSHEAWSGLGEALQAQDSNQAPDCFLTALELEASSPVRPFTIIPREL